MGQKEFDYVVLGAGMYGLYAATYLGTTYPKRTIAVFEYDRQPFSRASYINQARVHNGYHYPRSLSTALKTVQYYERFCTDFSFAINNKFEKIYAVSNDFSYSTGDNFKRFCGSAGIPCKEIHYSSYFKDNTIEGCFLTQEVALDAKKICRFLLSGIDKCQNVQIIYNIRMKQAEKDKQQFKIFLENGDEIVTSFILNTTYASVNQVSHFFGFETFDVKYEISEICLCEASHNMKNLGLTVIDGPFFSVMPFGLSKYHSLSTVHFTPHITSDSKLPEFSCQKKQPLCTPWSLENCNMCEARPKTAWDEMVQLSKKYLNDNIKMQHHQSLFAVKPILKNSEVSDSRPTVIKTLSEKPVFKAVLSGKFNTIYDLEEEL